MGNEVVKYHNNLNEMPFRKFTSTEMDLFFMICSKVKEMESSEIDIPFEQIMRLSDYRRDSKKKFIADLRKTNKKLLTAMLSFEDERFEGDLVLFHTFIADKDENVLRVGINPNFEYIFNKLSGEFTRFELEEFVKLDSKYTKTLFRLLKQWRTIGRREFMMEEFRTLLAIPDSYKTGDIDRYILIPSKDELSHVFKNLRINKIKKGQGGRIIGYEFLFKKETVPVKNKRYTEPTPKWINKKPPIAVDGMNKLITHIIAP